MGKLFGTDGVRGIANIDLTPELAYKLGKASACVLFKNKDKTKVIIGKDTRISGDMLESAMVAGLLSVGVDVISLGVIPTPAIAHLVRELGADAGIMISASHNPAEYNGIKFFDSRGCKLSDDTEAEIEKLVAQNDDSLNRSNNERIGVVNRNENATELYMDYLLKTVKHDFVGMKIAIDTANGAAYKSAPMLLRKLGAEVYVINDKPDGMNINFNCGSTHLDAIKNLVKETNADIGISFDGDADRALAVDNKCQMIDGDYIMAICGMKLKRNKKLNENTIVATVMSNIGLDLAVKKDDIDVIKTKVGDRYVLEEMMNNNYMLGGEQSGHIIFLQHNTTGDGLLTAIQLIEAMKEEGKTLEELASVMTSYPQILVNARVKNENKNAYLNDEVIAKKIEEIESSVSGKGRVLIRPSGTEPLVRVMLEGENQIELEYLATKLAKLIESRLN
ncbi:MAG: phosphoglucosamine mutase [Alkaliphilus sp.]|nr:phosphoglucosamine mutase [bacterium AH-315-G05]PHS33829.1 MAG: phosphoglucosamine mutase [Alkaliphilus sp.]